MVDRRLFVPVLLTTMAAFFVAARYLPAVDTGAASTAAEAGFTNQLPPLLAILLAGALALAAAQSEPTPVDRPPGPAASHWRWHVAAAALLCLLAVNLDPVWSQARGYFGRRLMLMDAGARPYVDFEYAYGYLVAYLPFLLHRAGLPVGVALQGALSIAVLAGVLALAALTRRWIPDPRVRLAMFWSLVVCEAFVGPGPSLNYNFARYALPFALLGLLARRTPSAGPVWTFAGVFAATLLVYCISPEMGCAFSAAAVAWLAVAAVVTPARTILAGLGAVAFSLAALLAFARPMFVTLVAYGQAQVLMPIVANPVMVLTIGCVLVVAGAAGAKAINAWRDAAAGRRAAPPVEFCAMAGLSLALLPAVIGRAWPTITIAYGFVAIVLVVGRLLGGARRRWGFALAGAFAAYVAYVALPEVRADAGRVRAAVAGQTCAGASPCPVDRADAAAVERLANLRRLLAGFPRPYDPLAIAPATEPPPTYLGYYPGLRSGDVLTEGALALKRAEVGRAAYYVLPVDRRLALADARASSDRSLAGFAEVGLYPLPLGALTPGRRPSAEFIDLLYAGCRVVASSGGVQLCGREPAVSGGTSVPPAPPAGRRS